MRFPAAPRRDRHFIFAISSMLVKELKLRLRTLTLGKFNANSPGRVLIWHDAISSSCKLRSGLDGERHFDDSRFDDK